MLHGSRPLRAQDPGEAAYTEAGCARCHAVEARDIESTVSERLRGRDLGAVGADHDAPWVVAVVKREIEVDGRPHRAPFRGSDEQLAALAEWLVGLARE